MLACTACTRTYLRTSEYLSSSYNFFFVLPYNHNIPFVLDWKKAKKNNPTTDKTIHVVHALKKDDGDYRHLETENADGD